MLDMPPACLRSPPWGDDEASTELRINCGEHRCNWLSAFTLKASACLLFF
ncbi:MAG: hypothetical protein ACI9MR_001672 [Myxococcota bacterium]|jgi:hypothetical protein